jgi:hypothetical protein
MQTRGRGPGFRGTAAGLAATTVALACSPIYDWRESRPEGSGVALMFPCRPVPQERTVQIGAVARPMHLHSCRAGDATFMLGTVDVGDAAEVTPLLAAFRNQAAANLGAAAATPSPFAPEGATPNPQSAHVEIAASRPDGRRVVAQAAFFVKGLRLYQASVLGAEDARGREAAATFFGAIRLP